MIKSGFFQALRFWPQNSMSLKLRSSTVSDEVRVLLIEGKSPEILVWLAMKMESWDEFWKNSEGIIPVIS